MGAGRIAIPGAKLKVAIRELSQRVALEATYIHVFSNERFHKSCLCKVFGEARGGSVTDLALQKARGGSRR